MYYIQQEPLLDTSSAFFMEAEVRLLSGDSIQPYRGAIGIGFTTDPNIGNALWIEDGFVFFNDGELSAGTKVAVDTTDALHTYRIEYDGSGGLELFYDGDSILNSTTINSASLNTADQRILWGEYSIQSNSISEWASFTHNALSPAAVPEPSSALLVLMFGGFFVCKRSR